MKSPRKVIFTVSSLNSGGAERVAVTLCNVWAELGHSVTLVATFSGRGEIFYSISKRVNLIYLADTEKSKRKTIYNQISRLRSLRSLILKEQPDVIISFLTNVNIAVIVASFGMNIPVIVCERSNMKHQNLSLFLSIQRRIFYRYADVVAVQTKESIKDLFSVCYGIKKVFVVPNPYPPEIVQFNCLEYIEDKKKIIAMGRLVEVKNYLFLIEIFSLLSVKFHEWDLWIYGEGPLRTELEEQINRCGLSDRVFLPGATKNPWEEMAKSDIFVLTSHYEGFPNVLLEAMAVGLPCVAFDCQFGPREITRNGQDALLIPQGDKEKFIDALNELMSNKCQRIKLGQKATKSVRERYSLDKVLSLWEDLFNEILSNKSS